MVENIEDIKKRALPLFLFWMLISSAIVSLIIVLFILIEESLYETYNKAAVFICLYFVCIAGVTVYETQPKSIGLKEFLESILLTIAIYSALIFSIERYPTIIEPGSLFFSFVTILVTATASISLVYDLLKYHKGVSSKFMFIVGVLLALPLISYGVNTALSLK